jgi:Tfp pilus assembly protein PilX
VESPLRRIASLVVARLRREEGVALVVALGATIVLGALGSSVFLFSTSNGQAARLDSAEVSAHSVAEAGIQQALSVLNLPSNNALNPTLVPACATGNDCVTVQLSTGYAKWGGTLTVPATGNPYWLVTSTGYVTNPDSQSPATSTIKVQVGVVQTLTHPLNNPAWNYIYATHPVTPGVCDETIQQSVTVMSPLYVNGNLCLQNTASIGAGPLDVQGSLTMFQKQNGVGAPNAKISDAHIGGGCQWWNKGYHNPCQGPQDNVYATVLDSSFVPIPPPQVFWDTWYLNASPGPYFPCLNPSGPVPVFDNDAVQPPSAAYRNNSVATPFNLTPSVSYTCKTAGGELSWDATKNVLTVNGTVFIDGSAYIQNGAVNTYKGMGTIYLSGTFLEKNSKLCATVNAQKTDCDPTHWDPNHTMLGIVANGQGGIVNPNDSEQFVSSTFEGAVYATHDIDTDTTSVVEGPMLGNAINLGQSVNTSFPKITILPEGFPSNPAMFAQPQQPIYLTG